MPKTRYDASLWIGRFPAGRRPEHPRFRGRETVEVAIVGGGLTGCAIAYALATAGVKAVLLEAGRIGHGSTAGSPGLVCDTPEPSFRETSALHGLRATRLMWQMTRRASLDFAAALRRLRIRCDLAPAEALHVASQQAAGTGLRREYQTRREAGLDVAWLHAAPATKAAGFPAYGAMRTRGSFQIDPYRAAIGLARAAAARGVRIFEQTPVERVRAGRKAVEVRTAGGELRAGTIILATNRATALVRPLLRHFKPFHTYAVATPPLPSKLRAAVAWRAGLLVDTAAPPHRLRWTPDNRIVFSGADQPAVPDRLRAKTLVQRGGQLMYELSTLYPELSGTPADYAWDAAYGRTADGLPFIGPHRNYPRHLFALGNGQNGLEIAFLASRILLRRLTGEPGKGDELFDFTRMLSIRH